MAAARSPSNTRRQVRLENDPAGNNIDLGGAWIWPRQHQQPQIDKLIKSLGIHTFLQPGDSSSTRIVGGAAGIVKAIVDELPPTTSGHDENENGHQFSYIQTNSPVVACRRIENSNGCTEQSLVITVELASGKEIHAKRVVLAAPPKLISLYIKFDPPLSDAKTRAMALS
jgi:hypothetical protein